MQALPYGITVTPGVRYTSQSAADFYRGPPFPRGYVRGGLYSADTRLAAFGAVTPGIAIREELADGWSVDLKLEAYSAASSVAAAAWRRSAGSRPSARWIQMGVARAF